MVGWACVVSVYVGVRHSESSVYVVPLRVVRSPESSPAGLSSSREAEANSSIVLLNFVIPVD